MDNKQYLETLLASYVAKNKSTEELKEYLIQVNQLLVSKERETTQKSSQNKGYKKKSGAGQVTGGLKYPEHRAKYTNQHVITNFFMLGFITLLFEMIFILISLYIY